MKSKYKLLSILLIIFLTYSYSLYQRNVYRDLYEDKVPELILEKLPEFEVTELDSNKIITNHSIYGDSPSVVIVHFWATWCAPCEVEFPDMISYTKKLAARNVTFLLIAVNDDEKKVRKFLRKYRDVSDRVIYALDPKGVTLDSFGTVKLPETYLFDQSGKTFKKLVGPQEWNNQYYLNIVTSFIEKQ